MTLTPLSSPLLILAPEGPKGLSKLARCGWLAGLLGVTSLQAAAPAEPPPKLAAFFDRHCANCHDDVERKGGLDLTKLPLSPDDRNNATQWEQIFDRVHDGEMPPKRKPRPPAAELTDFLGSLSDALTQAESQPAAARSRVTLRRLNRHEYENTLRDLFDVPWLQVKDMLPEDGEFAHFNKSGDALDISHVQMGRYLAAADSALRQAMAPRADRPATSTIRYYAREQTGFIDNLLTFRPAERSNSRAKFPVLGKAGDPEARAKRAPFTVGETDPARRELEGMGVVANWDARFNKFRASLAGRYRLRVNAYSIWVGLLPNKPTYPNIDDVSPGRRHEPVVLYAESVSRATRRVGAFDVTTEPAVYEIDTWLLAGETIRPEPAQLFRSRSFSNPRIEPDGMPGVAFRWLEVEGPLVDEWPGPGHRLLFGDLSLRKNEAPDAPNPLKIDVISADPAADSERLLRGFIDRVVRRPIAEADVQEFLRLVTASLAAGNSFAGAMLTGYSAVLCSPAFLYVEEPPGRLDDLALATRLALFLWNAAPDAALLARAARGELLRPEILRAETERLLRDPKSRRFTDAFLDYWLELRHIDATFPDISLYGDYYFDDLLLESAVQETQLFFDALLHENLPARNLIASDFTMLNERLAAHYRLPPVEGVELRNVPLPADSVRGGLLTQAAILKVTANGTTTSPVVRGAWITDRLLGRRPSPPPPAVAAVEPDIRGGTTIRELLALHRADPSCAACHAKFDPPGFALESFDVFGGWRDHYRAIGSGGTNVTVAGHNGAPFTFFLAQTVDPSGELADGRTFQDVRDLKRLLLQDEAQIARNLVRQLLVFSTGTPTRFSDRPAVERILQQTAADGYGVRSLVHAIVQSDLFQTK